MHSYRCIDDSGGYLHHDTGMASRIITSCCCLHNLARKHQVPLPINENEEDRDGHRPRARLVREQPPTDPGAAAVERRGDVLSRAAFIRDLFT